MNKISAFVAFLLLAGVSHAQKSIGLVHGTDETFYVDENMPDGFKSCKIKFFNQSESDITIEYSQVELDFPESWLISFCDNRDCLPNFPSTGVYAPIKPGDTTDMKLDVFPIGGADSAMIKYAIWDQSKPNEIDTLIYRVYARWGLKVNSINEFNTRVYPNPISQDILNVSGTQIEEILVYNPAGKLMFKQDFNKDNAVKAKINQLESGNYIIRVRHAEGVGVHHLQIAR